MKKVLYIFAISTFMLTACNSGNANESTEGENNNATENTNAEDPNAANPNVSTEDIGNARTAEDPYANSATQPKMEFNHVEHHFGKVVEGEKVKHTYTFQNVGNADLLITSAKASCGCTVPEWPKTAIKPGETSQITVEFNSAGKLGNNAKEVVVEANTNPPVTKLRFTCEVVEDTSKK